MTPFGAGTVKYPGLKLILVSCRDTLVVNMLLYLRGEILSGLGLDVHLATLIDIGLNRGLWQYVRELCLLLVVIEALDLTQELRCYLVKRRHLVGSDGHLDVWQVPYDRLEFGVVHTK